MTDTTVADTSSSLDIAGLLQTGLSTALTLLTTVAPFVKGAGTVGAVIDGLATILPIVVSTAQNLAPVIKDTISILRGADDITDEQLAALDAFEAVIDADFDDAAAMAIANDNAVAAAAAAKAALAA